MLCHMEHNDREPSQDLASLISINLQALCARHALPAVTVTSVILTRTGSTRFGDPSYFLTPDIPEQTWKELGKGAPMGLGMKRKREIAQELWAGIPKLEIGKFAADKIEREKISPLQQDLEMLNDPDTFRHMLEKETSESIAFAHRNVERFVSREIVLNKLPLYQLLFPEQCPHQRTRESYTLKELTDLEQRVEEWFPGDRLREATYEAIERLIPFEVAGELRERPAYISDRIERERQFVVSLRKGDFDMAICYEQSCYIVPREPIPQETWALNGHFTHHICSI